MAHLRLHRALRAAPAVGTVGTAVSPGYGQHGARGHGLHGSAGCLRLALPQRAGGPRSFTSVPRRAAEAASISISISTIDPPAPRPNPINQHPQKPLRTAALGRRGLRRTSREHLGQYHVAAVKMADPEPHARLAQRVPAGAWDSHMHIVDPANYALGPTAAYHPSTFTLSQALAFEASVGIRNIVLVQPSIYGVDNACMLDALRELGPQRGRAVVQFDPATTSPALLREWHQLGVRGVRLNIQSNAREIDAQELSLQLHQYADAVRELDWVVQVYVPMPLIALLEPIVPTLNVRFCIDHIGHPVLKDQSSSDPYDLPGFSSLVRLLQGGRTYLKLSAPYRISRVPGYGDVEPIARELIKLVGSTRIVFATDWPHTRFEGLDIRPWMETVMDWCADDDVLLQRLFTGNAEDLWDVTRA